LFLSSYPSEQEEHLSHFGKHFFFGAHLSFASHLFFTGQQKVLDVASKDRKQPKKRLKSKIFFIKILH
jgi:hypothetical protein